MTLPEIHRRSVKVITREQLHKKVMAFKPGHDEHPGEPSITRNPPRDNCPLCMGTGWALSTKYATFLVCKCTGEYQADYTPTDYTDV